MSDREIEVGPARFTCIIETDDGKRMLYQLDGVMTTKTQTRVERIGPEPIVGLGTLIEKVTLEFKPPLGRKSMFDPIGFVAHLPDSRR